MTSYSDFPMTFAPTTSHAFGTAPSNLTQPFKQDGLPAHQLDLHVDAPLAGLADAGMDARMSIGAAQHPHAHPLSDVHGASPDSVGSLGVHAIGDTMADGSTLTMKLEDAPALDGSDGARSKRDSDANADPPTWSEMKTKAGKDRKRLPLACIACRRKKIRCSGEKPACKHCLRSRIPCVYKVTTRKAAPRTDYMAMLDKRLKRMEDRVIKLIPKESMPAIAGVGRSIVKPALPGAPSKPSNGQKKRGAEEAFGHGLDEWASSGGAHPDAAGGAARSREADETSLLTEGADSLPSMEIQQHLAEVYFDFVYGQSYPLLHKPSFMRRLAADKVPPVLMLAICAISARFSTHPQLRTEPCFLRGDDWAARARQISLKRFDSPNITILIVYLLLGLHEFGTCQGGRSWMFGGMAQRMAYALQLHKEFKQEGRETEKEQQQSVTDREIRRRTMWACFLMDRFNSSGTDRPIFVNEQYIEVQLPVKEHFYIQEIPAPTEDIDGNVPSPVSAESGQLSSPRDNMGVTAYTVRLVGLWGKLIKYVNLGGKEKDPEPMWSPKSVFSSIKQDIKAFRENLPENLRYSPENLQNHAIGRTANAFLYLHIILQQITLFMHRFALPSTAGSRPPKDMPHDFLTDSGRTALDAANQVSTLINEAMDHNVVAPFAGYSAFYSSTVHVHGVFSKNPKLEAQSKKYLAYNVKYLSKMKKYWGMFHYMAENLKELYRAHADASLRGHGIAGEKGKGTIFQYGDWFDRYPHGVSKTDYEDAAESSPNEPGTDAVLGQKSDLQSVEEFFASLSPPSRAEQQRKQARKKKSVAVPKSEQAAPTNAPAQQQGSRQRRASQLHQHMNQMNMNPQESMDFDPAYFAQQQYLQELRQQQQQQQQHPSHPNHNLMLNTSPSVISHQPGPQQQIDLSPFTDMSAHASAQTPAHHHMWTLDHTGMPTSNAAAGFLDPGNAGWFLPFNVDPPTMGSGDDGGIFGADAFGLGLGLDGTGLDLGLGGAGGAGDGVRGGGMDGMDGMDGVGR